MSKWTGFAKELCDWAKVSSLRTGKRFLFQAAIGHPNFIIWQLCKGDYFVFVPPASKPSTHDFEFLLLLL